jgi:Skp family chaperone for outer membrane proteins
VAVQLGLLMVLEKSKGSPTIFADGSLDITNKVIEELNKGAK